MGADAIMPSSISLPGPAHPYSGMHWVGRPKKADFGFFFSVPIRACEMKGGRSCEVQLDSVTALSACLHLFVFAAVVSAATYIHCQAMQSEQ